MKAKKLISKQRCKSKNIQDIKIKEKSKKKKIKKQKKEDIEIFLDENQGTSTEIYIEGFLTYNCPDGIEDSEENSIGEYLYSGEGIINETENNFYSFDLY